MEIIYAKSFTADCNLLSLMSNGCVLLFENINLITREINQKQTRLRSVLDISKPCLDTRFTFSFSKQLNAWTYAYRFGLYSGLFVLEFSVHDDIYFGNYFGSYVGNLIHSNNLEYSVWSCPDGSLSLQELKQGNHPAYRFSPREKCDITNCQFKIINHNTVLMIRDVVLPEKWHHFKLYKIEFTDDKLFDVVLFTTIPNIVQIDDCFEFVTSDSSFQLALLIDNINLEIPVHTPICFVMNKVHFLDFEEIPAIEKYLISVINGGEECDNLKVWKMKNLDPNMIDCVNTKDNNGFY